MGIKRVGSQQSTKGPADWFTGAVRIDPLFEAPTPARARGASVTFEPGARTAWHIQPLGQTLIVTARWRKATTLWTSAAPSRRCYARKLSHAIRLDPNGPPQRRSGPPETIEIARRKVRKGGLEPPRVLPHRILNPARLPIPPLSRDGCD